MPRGYRMRRRPASAAHVDTRAARLLGARQSSRSTLEVKARRLLHAKGYTDFVREFPLDWNGRAYRFDFCFEQQRTILETNGRRWHELATTLAA